MKFLKKSHKTLRFVAFLYPKQSLGITVFSAKKIFPNFFIVKVRKSAFLVSNVPAKIHLAAKAELLTKR
jgi:hypothetical protein